MRLSNTQLAPGCDVVWENSKHGSAGWALPAIASRNTTGDIKAILQRDTGGLTVKNMTTDEVVGQEMLLAANAIAVGVRFDTGQLDDCYGADWAGRSNSKFYAMTSRKVVRWDGAQFVACAAITGQDIRRSLFRQCGQALVSDPDNENVFYAFSGNQGLHRSLDQGATLPKMAWMPTPTHPYAGSGQADEIARRVGLIAIDTSSAKVNAGTSTERFSRIAFNAGGVGVWLSTDGATGGSKISPASPHALDSVTCLIWDNGTLYAVSSPDKTSWQNNNGDGNLYRWDGGTTWTALPTGQSQSVFSIVRDPRGAGWFLMSLVPGNYAHTKNITSPAAFKLFDGGGPAFSLAQMKTRARPFVSRIYKQRGGGSAPGQLTNCGGFFYFPYGYGHLRHPIATFPTDGASFGNLHYSTAWPDLEEDTASYEAVVGQGGCWLSGGAIGFGQDVGNAFLTDDTSGHETTYREYPGNGVLTNGIHTVAGTDLNFGAAAILKGGPKFGVTLDGKNFTQMPFQPNNNNYTGDGPSGAIVCGPNAASGTIMFFPSFGGVPEYTDTLGQTDWKPLRFFLANGTEFVPTEADSPFRGANYASNHFPAAHDPFNPGTYYASAYGTGDNDTGGRAGLYKMIPSEPGIFRQVLAGNVFATGNRGYYHTELNFTGDGHLLITNNSVPGTGEGNYSVDIDLVALTKRQITAVYNMQCMTVGAGLPGGPRACWAAGRLAGTGKYAWWLSFDRFQTVYSESGTPKPFNHMPPRGGLLKHVKAHPSIFGLFAAGLDAGHALGSLIQKAA